MSIQIIAAYGHNSEGARVRFGKGGSVKERVRENKGERRSVTFSSQDIGPIISFCLIFHYLNLLPLIIGRLHWTASFISLIPYHPNLQLFLVLSSG